MIKHILIPTDFSPAAWRAVQYALNLANRFHADITLLHVYPSENKYMSWIATHKDEDDQILNQLKVKLKEFSDELPIQAGTKIDCDVVKGNVTREIGKFATDHHFDLIIMGVNSGTNNNNPGSHTAEIIRDSGYPVMIIPNIDKTKTAVAS